MSERVKIIAAILLALACSAWMFMRWMPTSPAERAKVDERRSEIAGVGQKLLAELSSRPLTDFSTPEQFVNATVELFPPAEVGSSRLHSSTASRRRQPHSRRLSGTLSFDRRSSSSRRGSCHARRRSTFAGESRRAIAGATRSG